jgi:hypothetical protein
MTMARKRLLTGLAVVASLGAVAVWRRRFRRNAERVDIYYEDGSSISLAEGSEGADRLLPYARRVLAAARG